MSTCEYILWSLLLAHALLFAVAFLECRHRGVASAIEALARTLLTLASLVRDTPGEWELRQRETGRRIAEMRGAE